MKAKCIDNKNYEKWLTIGNVYDVTKDLRDGKDYTYFKTIGDDGHEVLAYQRRFEIVKNKTKSKEEKNMKIYFRDDKGQFCTAKDFFGKQNQLSNLMTESDFQMAENQYNALVRFYKINRDKICLLILGANKVKEHSCNNNDYLNITFNRYGECTIQYQVNVCGGDRKPILNRVFEKIEHIIEVQKGYMDRANAQYVEV